MPVANGEEAVASVSRNGLAEPQPFDPESPLATNTLIPCTAARARAFCCARSSPGSV